MKRLDFIRSIGILGLGLLLPWQKTEPHAPPGLKSNLWRVVAKVDNGYKCEGKLTRCPKCGNPNSCTSVLYAKSDGFLFFDEFCHEYRGGCGYNKTYV